MAVPFVAKLAEGWCEMKGKDLLGSLSPAYGMATGRGAFGKLTDSMGYGMGIVPGMLADSRKRKKDGTPMTPAEEAATAAKPGMKKGGKVKTMASGGSASKRADGIAQRGKTRGKMC
jgi:hypothetical protein